MKARELHGLAASQQWLLHKDQLLQHMTDRQVRHAVERGEIILKAPNVYAPWGAPDSWAQRVRAACMASGGVASMRSAGRLHRLDVPAVRVEITVPRPRQVRFAMDGLIVHQTGLWLPEHLTNVDGIPCTTPERTCIDLSAVLGTDSLERAWASAHGMDLVTPESLRRTAVQMIARGRRRMTIVHELLERWDPRYSRTESELEARVLRWLLADGMDPPELQLWVVANGQRYRLDMAWPALKICVECDGFADHKVRTRFDSDRDKIPELELAGWLVIPVTSRHDRATVVGRVRRAFALRTQI